MTRAVILAAGEGTRLRPLTEQLPKVLVPLAGHTLLERQRGVLARAGIHDVHLVTGHAADRLAASGLPAFHNPRFATTNMVASLLCAQSLFDGGDDVLVAYGDIVYQPHVLAAVLGAGGPLAVAVDQGWHRLWALRMDDPLADAESMRIDDSGHILELGRRAADVASIQGQYIGLFKVARSFAPQFFQPLLDMAPDAVLEGRPRDRIFMTAYLQQHIDRGVPVRAACFRHGWLEIDSLDDLRRYQQALQQGTLTGLYDPQA